MLSAITAWFAKEGVGLLLGALAKVALDAWDSYRGDQALRELGRVTAERDQEAEARAATERELEAQQNAPQTVDDAVKRYEEGSA